MDRPFRVQRLGHFGLNAVDVEAALYFYRDLLGFMVSDVIDGGARLTPAERAALGDTRRIFTRHNTEHHTFVIFPARLVEHLSGRPGSPNTINQITWQVSSLQQVVESIPWFASNGYPVRRAGRDTPGSNWNAYAPDADGTLNELYYGMEQIGWDGLAKPMSMHSFGFRAEPELPQPSEADEVAEARTRGDDLGSGFRHAETPPRQFDVEGIRLARPFKVVGIGPVRLFTPDMAKAEDFYRRVLGLRITAETSYQGHRVVLLGCGPEHHAVGLYPLALRERLGLSPHTNLMSFGLRVASYRQLRAALAFLASHGVTVRDLPPQLTPGIDYAAYAIDPDGHAIELYWSMEQVVRCPAVHPERTGSRRPERYELWPETIEDDSFGGEVFLGPWG
jgi:catechol 2,3-dioxygenase-like lactoylglutathione lyase family enzyme